MALQKSIQLDTGYTGDYWKITKIVHYVGGQTDVTLSCFKDKEASDTGFREITEEVITLNLKNSDVLTSDFLSFAYIKIKEKTPDVEPISGSTAFSLDFKNAKDV